MSAQYQYTIVVLCECGCDNSEVHHVTSRHAESIKVWKQFHRRNKEKRLISMFEGFQSEILNESEVYEYTNH